MSAKKVFFAALLGMCWSWCTVQAQGLAQSGTSPAPVPQPGAPTTPPVPAGDIAHEGGTGLSSWITYERHDCCGGRGGGTPILVEAFVRVGPAFPMGGEFFGRNLDTGWMIAGAARTMFFNHALSAAWAVELGISNTYNPSTSTDTTFLDHTVNQVVSIRSLDRTFANVGLGREWYLWTSAGDDQGAHLRWGADVGGRYGSATVQFNEIRHRTQVIEGFYTAIHADVEIPHGRWTYLAGIRGEYGFTWSNIFAKGDGNMQDMTLLVNFGARY